MHDIFMKYTEYDIYKKIHRFRFKSQIFQLNFKLINVKIFFLISILLGLNIKRKKKK